MKKPYRIIAIALLTTLLLSGCAQKQMLEPMQKETNSVLEKLSSLAIVDENKAINLTFQTVELAVDADLSGKVAFVYKKEVSKDLINQEVNKLYKEDGREKVRKDVVNSVEELLVRFDENYANLKDSLPADLVTSLEGIRTSFTEFSSLTQSDEVGIIELIQEISELQKSFDATAPKLAGYKQELALVDSVLSMEEIKSTNVPYIINYLTVKSDKLKILAEKNFEKAILKQINTAFSGVLTAESSSLKVKEVSSNDKEIFAVLKFKSINELYGNTQIATIGSIQKNENTSDQVKLNLIKTELKFITYNLKPAFLLASTEMVVEDIKYRMEQLEMIKLDLIQHGYVRDFNNKIVNYNKQYDDEANAIFLAIQTELNQMTVAEAVSKKQDFINTLDTQIKALDLKYEALVNTDINDTIVYLNNYVDTKINVIGRSDKKDDPETILKYLNGYPDRVQKFKEEQKSISQLAEDYKGMGAVFIDFNQPLPFNLRYTVTEGKMTYKLNDNKLPDVKYNYQINATESGLKSVRIVAGTSDAMFLFETDFITQTMVERALLIFLGFLVVLFFVKRAWFVKIVTLIALLTIAVIVIYPIVWAMGASFNKTQSLAGAGISPIPKDLSLLQFERLFRNTKYIDWYKNSFKIAFFNMIFCTMFTVTTAYIFSRFRFKGKKTALLTVLVLQIFPSFAAMSAIYMLLSKVTIFEPLLHEPNLINTHLGLLLVYLAGSIPFNTYLVKGYFDTIPRELDEAALIDGANHLTAYFKIILPLGRPIISFVAVTTFMAPWMDFIFPRLLLKTAEKKTLALGLFELINGRENNQFTMFAAGALLVAVPITILFGYFQKFIVTGLSSGAVKG